MHRTKFRLVTRSDFDGLVCAVLLRELGMVDEIRVVHPKDMQDGKIDISDMDITTNLPYVPGAYLVFDHHMSEMLRNPGERQNHIIDPDAPSAARVVYDHFGGREAFPDISEEMMSEVDKADAAQFTMEEVLDPKGWTLLSFLMDSRTGLGRFSEFRVSNYTLMMDLINYCRMHAIEQILELPDVQERLRMYRAHSDRAKEQIRRCVTLHGNLAVLDLREEDPIWATNRFMVYALFPQANISIHVMWGKQGQNTVFATGKSIVNRTSLTNVGKLMLRYGGGGHYAAGTCQVDSERAGEVLRELIAEINADG
jgi:nanoRNase/pAp phosphatase (c-di-AMP/oligoRNAs hydrolase)